MRVFVTIMQNFKLKKKKKKLNCPDNLKYKIQKCLQTISSTI